MEVNNNNEIVQTIHKELSQILTENFYGKYVNNDTCSDIKRFCDEYCHKILAENVELMKHIDYEIKVKEDLVSIELLPLNLFTGLIFKNIFFIPAVYGETKYACEGGEYSYTKENGFCFKPLDMTNNIDIILNHTNTINDNIDMLLNYVDDSNEKSIANFMYEWSQLIQNNRKTKS